MKFRLFEGFEWVHSSVLVDEPGFKWVQSSTSQVQSTGSKFVIFGFGPTLNSNMLGFLHTYVRGKGGWDFAQTLVLGIIPMLPVSIECHHDCGLYITRYVDSIL